jgi:hypothetical protein
MPGGLRLSPTEPTATAVLSCGKAGQEHVMKDRDDSIEETENMEQKQSRQRARKVERSRDATNDDRRDLDPSPNQRTVQPSDRTRKTTRDE